MAQGKQTTDHDSIREWAEERGGRPARVEGTEDREGGGVLRFDFGEPDERLEEISWEQFFEIFERSNLALVLQDETADGHTSRFSRFVAREDGGRSRSR